MFKMLQFKCKKCGASQEELVNSDEKPEEKCKACGAKPSFMVRDISVPTHGNHVSWSKWRV
jgi:putative FmdB family regulatory protein